ncbi:MAG: AmmeMemoRadiSam system radical SAM enzyme [Clostridiales bacterium]|jgi:pyruvate formate lyase activating enzyme|nr:AmmeMemoRadiSam system radical SAM enzyme [Clostridiales bacterium]
MIDKEAIFYQQTPRGVRCSLCPWECELPEGALGRCKARRSRGGKLIAESYGMITSASLDPIEKKPLNHFFPGSFIFSIGLYGCNLHCPFCQNHRISMSRPETSYASPEDIAALAERYARDGNNLGVAYTYNEPMIAFEYVLDCTRAVHARGLKNVAVTNGCINEEPFNTILPYIDAFNIDLKGSAAFYKEKLGGDLDTVKRNIRSAASQSHVEVTTLIIPGENDSDEETEESAEFLSGISPDLPLHLSRFIPQYKYARKQPTPAETMRRLRDIAEKYLKHVHLGNM